MKVIRQIGSLAFVLGLFTVVFIGVPICLITFTTPPYSNALLEYHHLQIEYTKNIMNRYGQSTNSCLCCNRPPCRSCDPALQLSSHVKSLRFFLKK